MGTGLIGLGQLLAEHTHRDAIARDVVHDQREHVLSVGELDQARAQHQVAA